MPKLTDSFERKAAESYCIRRTQACVTSSPGFRLGVELDFRCLLDDDVTGQSRT